MPTRHAGGGVVKHSTDRIVTTHAGSLSRPPDLIALNRARASGDKVDDGAYAECLSSAVTAVVSKQQELGIDVPDDGEFGKPMAASYDYGVWWNYAFARMDGFVPADSVPESAHRKSSVADLALTTVRNRRDWQKFSEFYLDPDSTGTLIGSAPRRATRRPVCTAPIRYTGQAAIQSDIANLKKAMQAANVEEGFMCSIAPGSFARGENLYHKTEEEFVLASAEAMREEYKAIIDAGIVLQIDDPSLPDNWDMINPEPPLGEFKKFERIRIEALNHALRGLPEDRIRYHICWGSWHGPHTTDIPLKDIVDLVLIVNAGAYSVEAGNVRHEHEWRVWKDAKLPEGKLLIPGVVSHATNLVEHPQVVADRIVRFAQIVGRENVIAGTDCGLGGRIHPQVAWAKLAALADGAKLATSELWR
jgi:5-methyltetrahydropteroyltriglutamate--homocysteine methyltransferase